MLVLTILLQSLLFWFPGASTSQQNRPTPLRINARSPHGPLAVPCDNCHTLSSWKPIRNTPEFDHNRTRFPIRGMHQNVSCAQCHISLVFSNVGTTCSNCHADIHRGQFGGRCEECHSEKGWTVSLQSIQNHQNRFPLVGAHAVIECESCHRGAATSQFAGLATDCLACHAQEFQSAKSPDHQALGFSTSCQSCHSMAGWVGALFDHQRVTGFALTGAHSSLDCVSCHVGGRFQGTPANCYGCHASDYNTASNPNHVQAGFPTECQTCHATASWSGATFDHNSFTRFPLTGAHVSVPCSACHVNGQFAGTATDCFGCHAQDYNRTSDPNHVQGGFPTACQTCHSTSSWQGAQFDHSRTAFPLTGAHVSVACSTCHVNGQFAGLGTDCVTCHLPNFNQTTNPNHVQSGFPQTCAVCHSTAAWQPAAFDHNLTSFPLTGAHVSVACETCHTNGRFTGTPSDCFGCHANDFNGTTDPNHAQAGFPTTCQTCHATSTWSGASFNHNTLTRFPLTGAHVSVACSTCHVNGQFAGTPQNCFGCHAQDYNGTTDPNHVQAGFPTECSACHSTTNWSGASFDHSRTAFPLTGAHVNVACTTCHVNGQFAGLGTSCVTCHLADYTGTTNPNHAQAGFPQQCNVCHNTSTWQGATFDHNNTGFPLTGAHVSVACANCHLNGNYSNTPTDCYACHSPEYQGTTDPNHTAAAFPTTCQTCHTTTRWTGATFDHTWFPIYSGTHRGEWNTCADCHINPANYATFSCITCHRHDQASTDPRHSGVRNYVYNGTSCYSCHPQGRQ
jgi:hypothetical protein